MLSKVYQFILEFIWGKGLKVLAGLFKKIQINSEVSKEEDEIKIITDEIKAYIAKNPGADVPKDMEDRLRAAVLKRNRGL